MWLSSRTLFFVALRELRVSRYVLRFQRPALVIGVPVGFVSAAESKEVALALPVPYIVVRGRKGGSPIAVAIIHALLLLSTTPAASEGTR